MIQIESQVREKHMKISNKSSFAEKTYDLKRKRFLVVETTHELEYFISRNQKGI